MTVSELANEISLLEYASQYLEFEFRNKEYWALSPFKEENTPSFSINEEKNVFKDFASGKGGNIITFIMEFHQCSFKNAVDRLLNFAKIENDAISFTSIPIVKELKKFKKNSKKSIQIERKEISEYELSKFVCDLPKEWAQEGILKQTCLDFNIRIDFRTENIIIPIYDNEGKLINFSLRTTKENYKNFGIPKYIYKYKLQTIDFFYGWNLNILNILNKKEIILVEGAKSVMKLHQWGYDNACAILTSHITEYQIQILISLGLNVVIAFDKGVDPSLDENLRKLKRFCKVFIAYDKFNLISDKDAPCDKDYISWKQIYENKKLWR